MLLPRSLRTFLLIVLAGAIALFGLVAPSAAATDTPRIHLIHGIPGVPVDVEVAGAAVIEDFEFSETEDLSALAGTTLADLKVKLAGTDEVAIDVGDLALPATGNITAIAHLDATGKPTVSVFSNSVSTVAAGQGRLVVRHTAAAPAVDVRAGGAVVFANVVNGEEGSVDLPAGTVQASVVPTGTTQPVVIGPAALPVQEGSSLIVYAVGSLEADSLTVLTETIPGLDGHPTAVHTGNAPVTPAAPAGTDGGLGSSGYLVLLAAAVLAVGTLWSHGPALLARVRIPIR